MKPLKIRKNTGQLKGYTYQIIHISAANSPLAANLVSHYC